MRYMKCKNCGKEAKKSMARPICSRCHFWSSIVKTTYHPDEHDDPYYEAFKAPLVIAHMERVAAEINRVAVV